MNIKKILINFLVCLCFLSLFSESVYALKNKRSGSKTKKNVKKTSKSNKKGTKPKVKKKASSSLPSEVESIAISGDDDVPTIRVLLEELDVKSADKKFNVIAESGFSLISPARSASMVDLPDEELKFAYKSGKLYMRCGDQKYRKVKSGDIQISPVKKMFKLNERVYQGELFLKIDPKTNNLLLVNQLDFDAYIYSVLRFETVPSWPLEMHKAQAVASRSYAMFLVEQARKKGSKDCFYDIKNTNFHQIYNGAHGCTHLWEAVNQTKNIIMTYNNQPVFAMFDICCGSVVPGDLRYRDRAKPYLCREYACPYCQRSTSYYRWNTQLGKHKLLSSLKNNPKLSSKFDDFGNLLDIQIVDKDKAGVAHKVKLVGSNKKVVLTGKELKSCVSLKSSAFSLKSVNDNIVISGKGYGHHTGLCQWGAKSLAEDGWSYKKILKFYYPNTKLARIV